MRVFDEKSASGSLSRSDALACRPAKNDRVKEQRLTTGDVVLSYSVTVRPWFARLVRRMGGPDAPVRMKKLQLDTLGTCVWDMIDGRRSVQQVIGLFAETHQLHPREAEISVTAFLRELGKRGLVGLK